jgi:hypothetical protein
MCKTHGVFFSFHAKLIKLFPFLSCKARKISLFLVV